MDAYLQIAETVLRMMRRPLTARMMLEKAYVWDLVPAHLFGRTQHKTLGARLSEDILEKRDNSVFFRTEPGKFFLREFIGETSLPEKYRRPMIARRRIRDLFRDRILALFEEDFLYHNLERSIGRDYVLELIRKGRFTYADPKKPTSGLVFLWSFVCVRQNNSILSYRVGKYRDQRDEFVLKKTIGFSAPVTENHWTLFNQDDLGIVDAGLQAVRLDLDIPRLRGAEFEDVAQRCLISFFRSTINEKRHDIFALIAVECPTWFEPTRRRLAMHDMRWLNTFEHINDFSAFDPWSQLVLQERGDLSALNEQTASNQPEASASRARRVY